jgi:hypothetical protein
MAIVALSSPIARAIQDYTGKDAVSVDVVPDPNFPGVYAIRAELDDTTLDFLIRDVLLQRVTENDLEEVEFKTWPPQVKQ